MSDGPPPAALVALALVACVGAGAWFLVMQEPEPEPEVEAPAEEPQKTVAKKTAKTVTRVEVPLRSITPDDELTKAIDEFVGKIPVRPAQPKGPTAPRPKAVVDANRGKNPNPVDFGLALDRAMVRNPGAVKEAAGLLVNGMNDFSDPALFRASLAIAGRLDAAGTRVLLDGLKTADPKIRPHLVMALRGSADPEVNQAFVDLYAADQDPVVRARAGFALGERGTRLPPIQMERARQVARDDLKADDTRLVKSAGDVLGVPPLGMDDRRTLERTLLNGTPEQRMTAWRALASAKVPPMELVPLLRQVAQDPKAGEVRTLAQRFLRQLEQR